MWIFFAALRPSETEVALFYPKYALLVFFAVFAARASLAA